MALNISQLGSGSMFINPNGGNLASNPTPFRVGILQDQSVSLKGENVKLFGQNRLPDVIGQGQLDLSLKVTFASLQGIPLSQAFLTGTVTAGVKQSIDNEPHTVPAATPFTVTVTNSANFLVDYGVIYQSTGRNLERVSGTPTQGEYAVSQGVYTFAAADAGALIEICYTFTLSATGSTFGYQNQKIGTGPSCQIVVYEPYTNALRGWLFNNCFCKSIDHPTKQKGFVIQTAEFDVADNPGGNAFEYYDLS